MPKLDRYLSAEFARAVFAALVILGMVSMGGVFADLIGEMARGKVPPTLLLSQLGLRLVRYLPLILPLGLLLGLLATQTDFLGVELPQRLAQAHRVTFAHVQGLQLGRHLGLDHGRALRDEAARNGDGPVQGEHLDRVHVVRRQVDGLGLRTLGALGQLGLQRLAGDDGAGNAAAQHEQGHGHEQPFFPRGRGVHEIFSEGG